MKIKINESQFKKLITHKELTEDPENVIIKKTDDEEIRLNFLDEDAITFGFFNNQPYVGYNSKFGQKYKTDFKKFLYEFDTEDELPKRYSWHGNIGIFTEFLSKHKILNKKLRSDFSRDFFDYPGRLWVNGKVVSFYKTPPKEVYIEHMKKLQGMINYVYDLNVNLLEFQIDIDSTGWNSPNILVSPEEYVYGTNRNAKDFDMSKMHVAPPEEKRNYPQMRAYLDYDEKMKGEKFQKTPEYEWNFWKNKNLAEDDTKQ